MAWWCSYPFFCVRFFSVERFSWYSLNNTLTASLQMFTVVVVSNYEIMKVESTCSQTTNEEEENRFASGYVLLLLGEVPCTVEKKKMARW
mmetsp:Transcript_14430/g.16806  ORF Transcript_14430/g.16806 Transcript_14430/m.16806 type:complete len:90 (-) Transcript_14430:199-468(-)